MNTKRIFLGSFIKSEKLYRFFNEIKTNFDLAGNFKWTKNENNLHITYIFLGETSINDINKIKKTLRDYIGKNFEAEINIKGLNYFTKNGKPTVLYAEIEDIEGKIYEIQQNILKLLKQNEIIEKVNKKFVPHITFARIKNVNKKFYDEINNCKNIFVDKINSIKPEITESVLLPSGAIYKTLKP